MKTEKKLKALKIHREALEVVNSTILNGSDVDLMIWKELNQAIKSIEKSESIIWENSK